MQLTPGLRDIVALAYSATGQLYAVDCAWQDPQAGGVYRLDDARWQGQPACRGVKIASLSRPTSLLFAPDGSLYVAAFGASSDSPQGTITKITGEF